MQANGLPLPLGLQIGPSLSVSPFSLGKEQSRKGTGRSKYPGLERPGRHLVAAVGRWPELSPPHLLAQASLLPHLHRWSFSSRSRGHRAASRPGHGAAPTHPDPSEHLSLGIRRVAAEPREPGPAARTGSPAPHSSRWGLAPEPWEVGRAGPGLPQGRAPPGDRRAAQPTARRE